MEIISAPAFSLSRYSAQYCNHEDILHKAHKEYEKFKQKQLLEPTEVANHFIEAEKVLGQIKPGKKKK